MIITKKKKTIDFLRISFLTKLLIKNVKIKVNEAHF